MAGAHSGNRGTIRQGPHRTVDLVSPGPGRRTGVEWNAAWVPRWRRDTWLGRLLPVAAAAVQHSIRSWRAGMAACCFRISGATVRAAFPKRYHAALRACCASAGSFRCREGGEGWCCAEGPVRDSRSRAAWVARQMHGVCLTGVADRGACPSAEDEYFPLGISESMNEEAGGVRRGAPSPASYSSELLRAAPACIAA